MQQQNAIFINKVRKAVGELFGSDPLCYSSYSCLWIPKETGDPITWDQSLSKSQTSAGASPVSTAKWQVEITTTIHGINDVWYQLENNIYIDHLYTDLADDGYIIVGIYPS